MATATMKLSEFASSGDSKSLMQIDGKSFTIVKVEDSDYSEGNDITKGVKITTDKEFEIDGEKYNKFHTTRTAIVSKLANTELRKSLAKGNTLGPVTCEEVTSKTGRKYIDLVDVE